MLRNRIDNNGWLREDTGDVALKVIFFLLSPFLSFLYSLRRMKTKSSFVVFFLFALMYGLCFTIIADNTGLLETSDAARWRYRFENTALISFGDYVQFCKEYFLFEGTDVRDIFFGTITYIVHLFTDNYHFFFFTVSLVFAYFQLKSLRILVGSVYFNNSIECLLICVLFTMNSIANISGVRFWTAAWMCVYGVLQVYFNGKKTYLVLLLFLPLIHRGFFFLYPILLMDFIFREKNIWQYAYFASFIFSGFSTYIIQDATPFLPPFLSYMIEAYTENTIVEQYSPTKLFLSILSLVYVNFLFILILLAAKRKLPDNLSRLYQFTLVFMSVVNFVMPIPSLGGRFLIIAEAFIALLWINILGTSSRYSWVIYLMPIFMIRPFYVGVDSFFRYQEIDFFYMSPFYLILSHI